MGQPVPYDDALCKRVRYNDDRSTPLGGGTIVTVHELLGLGGLPRVRFVDDGCTPRAARVVRNVVAGVVAAHWSRPDGRPTDRRRTGHRVTRRRMHLGGRSARAGLEGPA